MNPVSSEKAIRLMEAENTLVFQVARKANKPQIKQAIEQLFKVKIVGVRTLTSRFGNKYAYVKFSDDHPAIDLATNLGLM